MRTCRIGFVVAFAVATAAYVSSCTCPAPRGAEEPAPVAEQPESPPAKSEDLVGQVATFADETCACEDRACADAVASEFNDWAAAHSDAVGTNAAGDEVAAQVARMAACADKFAAALPLQGQKCTDSGECAERLECVRYRGIAGDKGPEFATCEIRCGEGGSCPEGMSCKTIADGPGNVCRK